MRSGRKEKRKTSRRQAEEATRATRRAEKKHRAGQGKKARRKESGTDAEEKSDYENLAEEIIRPAKERAHSRKSAHRGNSAEDRPRKKLKLGSPKMLSKEIRSAMKIPAPPKNPIVALMQPMVIVPDNAEDKPVIADAGTIIRLMDQSTLYRGWISPVTRRADEILVQYGKPDKLKLGWLTHKQDPKSMKPSTGPTFLVTTRSEAAINGWEQLRLKMALSRKKDAGMWLVPWLATHGKKYQRELREVTRVFGGKPIKNEPFEDRCSRLFTLILHTELDMASVKKSARKSATGKSGKATVANIKSKTSKKATKKMAKKSAKKSASKKSAVGKSDRITKAQDEHVIKRLVKENPRRAGTQKAKIWNKLKKGMTVGEFVEKGGTRGAVRLYRQNGWIKLLAPSGA